MIADYLANYKMDLKKSWFEVFDWPFADHKLDDCNLLAHCDGGSKHHSCSASAWIVEACIFVKGQWLRKVVAMNGTYFDLQISSFIAETVALNECLTFIRHLLERVGNQEPLGSERDLSNILIF